MVQVFLFFLLAHCKNWYACSDAIVSISFDFFLKPFFCSSFVCVNANLNFLFQLQVGFGWTNGVALQLLNKYGATLTSA